MTKDSHVRTIAALALLLAPGSVRAQDKAKPAAADQVRVCRDAVRRPRR